MIKETEEHLIYDKLPDYSILLVQVNCDGDAQGGLQLQLAKKHPQWFQDYRRHCGWFRDGHQHEMMGSFYAYRLDDKNIIASAFAQLDIKKTDVQTDYAAWRRILKNVEYQARWQKKQTFQPWTVHVQYGVGCGSNGGGDWETMYGLLQEAFGKSSVDLYIHNY